MEQSYTIEVAAPPAQVFTLVDDLAHYPGLVDIVHRVEPDPDPIPEAGVGPAWLVTLRARIGPLARSKRLRMVRSVHTPPAQVRFERRERDGRDHSDWSLGAQVAPAPNGSTVTMSLSYGGRLWTPVLQPVLEAQVGQAAARLEARAGS